MLTRLSRWWSRDRPIRISWITSTLSPVVIALHSNKADYAGNKNDERQGLNYNHSPYPWPLCEIEQSWSLACHEEHNYRADGEDRYLPFLRLCLHYFPHLGA
jgi:hypothetical protein